MIHDITLTYLDEDAAILIQQYRLGLPGAYHFQLAQLITDSKPSVWLKRRRILVAFCWIAGEPIGCSILDMNRRTIKIGRFKHLISVYVKPKYRKQAIGRQLIDRILSRVLITKAEIFADKGINGSTRFWSKMGIFYWRPSVSVSNSPLPVIRKYQLEELKRQKLTHLLGT